ncbi:MAG: hypothetical protein ACRDSF_10490 [Pseudonocardiaceae bacterium]
MEAAFLSFLEAIRRGAGAVSAAYAGWLVPHDEHERAILHAAGAGPVRLPGWVRDDLADRIASLIGSTVPVKHRDRLAELARYYLRPIEAKHPTASRATLSNWRFDAAEELTDHLRRPHPASLAFQPKGSPEKGERLSLDTLARDPACRWLLRLEDQERDVALYQVFRDAANEANIKADTKLLVGVALIAARLAPATNPEPVYDYDGVTPLRGLNGRKHSRTRLALPLVLMCAQRVALNVRQISQRVDTRAFLVIGQRLVDTTAGPLAYPSPIAGMEQRGDFDPDLLAEGIAHAWQMISTGNAKPILATLVRHAALAAETLSAQHRQDLALLSMAVARRHSDRRALDITVHHPSFRHDSADSVLFQLRFRRERLLLASHHDPDRDWNPELRGMEDLLTVRRGLLSADDARRVKKVQLHLRQGIHFRLARELITSGRPLDAVPVALCDTAIQDIIAAVDRITAALQASLRIADEDHDEIALVNAHRRKTEAEGIVHLLSRVRHPDALAGARRLQRDLNKLDDICFEEHTDARSDVRVLWLLAMADQAMRRNEDEQARDYVTAAKEALPAGIPHLAIRAANIAATIGEATLAGQLLARVPHRHVWPSYLRHLNARLRSVETGKDKAASVNAVTK